MAVTAARSETDTRSRILDAAEALFVQHGLAATSMRMITTQAGANIAAVHYHFGSKEGLIEAVFRRGLARLNELRLQTLDQLEREAGGAALKPRQVLEAFFGTALAMAADREHGGGIFMRLLGRTMTDPNRFIRAFLAAEYREVLERYKMALFAALPDVPREEIIWRLHFMLGAMSYALSGTGVLRLEVGIAGDDDPQAMAPRLMSFLLGGLRAPLPEQLLTAAAAQQDQPSQRDGARNRSRATAGSNGRPPRRHTGHAA